MFRFSRLYSTTTNTTASIIPTMENSIKPKEFKQSFNFSNPNNKMMRRILLIRRVARVNSGGKIRSISALVITGNGNGVGGYGIGRATDLSKAVEKATILAEKNMTFIPRFDNRTLFSDQDYKFMNMKMMIRTASPGHGIVAHNKIHEICRVLGISDISVKVFGSTNPMNLTKAFFDAIRQQKTPQDIARLRGRKVMDIEQTYYGFSNTSNNNNQFKIK